MATAYDTWKTDVPIESSPWDSCELAYMAVSRTHTDGEMVDAICSWLCSGREASDTKKLTERLAALGESAMDDYLNYFRYEP
jgi:hypothetical protein